jgi:hypothetical protein
MGRCGHGDVIRGAGERVKSNLTRMRHFVDVLYDLVLLVVCKSNNMSYSSKNTYDGQNQETRHDWL